MVLPHVVDHFLHEFPNWFAYSIFSSAFLAYYYLHAVKLPTLACSSPKFKTFLELTVPSVTEKYWPTFWCFESRIQTVLACILQSDILNISYERTVLMLEDGGEVALDWLHTENECENTPTILILPGLTGTSSTTYIKKIASAAQETGLRTVIFNYRGLGGVELKTPRTYCATNTTDLIQVIDYIKKKYPTGPLAATGISLGSLILGNFLSRSNDEQKLCAAMLICAPFDVIKATENIEAGLNVLLNRHLTKNLTDSINRVRPALDIDGKPWKIEEVLKSKTVREFDHTFTAKQFGYESADHYYQDANLVDKLKTVKIPLLCLSAADDPFQPLNSCEANTLCENGPVAILATVRGGHIAFLEGLWPFNKPREYMTRVFSQFFTAIFKNNSYKQFIL